MVDMCSAEIFTTEILLFQGYVSISCPSPLPFGSICAPTSSNFICFVGLIIRSNISSLRSRLIRDSFENTLIYQLVSQSDFLRSAVKRVFIKYYPHSVQI